MLGFLDLQASHAQNRFFNGLEEWLSGVTQLVDDVGGPAMVEPSMALAGDTDDASLGLLIEEIRAERRLLEELLEHHAGVAVAPPQRA